MAYDFYLEKCLLPIAPNKLQVKINNANSTITLINEGQVNLLKQPELTDIEFKCEIPQIPYPFAVYKSGFQEAAFYLDVFEALKTNRQPFQFIVSRTMPDGTVLFSTNLKVSMEEYKIVEDAKNGMDITVDIKLKQWRDYGTKTVNVMETGRASIEQPRAAESSPAPEAAQTYTVQKGDCLYNIAKKFYGNGGQYKEIYENNQNEVGGNPNLIYPGQVLTIPSL